MKSPHLGRFGTSVVLIAVGCSVGVAAASFVSPSPSDAAAQRAVPFLPSPTAQVDSRVMKDVVEAPCQSSASVVDVLAPALDAGEVGVVTAVDVAAGSAVGTGTSLAAVSGHHISAIVSPYPFYRDLHPGDRGDDVRNLEQALLAVKLLPTADDTFDAATGAAIAAMHRAAGQAPVDVLERRTVVAVPSGASVSNVGTSVGQMVEPGAVLMQVAADSGTLTCDLDPAVNLSVGDTADLATGQSTESVVVRQVSEPSQDQPTRKVVVAAPDDAPLTTSSGTLQIVRSQTDGKVTALPVAALRVGPAGGYLVTSSLTNAQGVTTYTDIPVEVGLISGGYAQVTAADLHAGDRVKLQGADAGQASVASSSGSSRSNSAPSSAESGTTS